MQTPSSVPASEPAAGEPLTDAPDPAAPIEPSAVWWYHGPTVWDPDTGKAWHQDCPDPEQIGHDGQVWFDSFGGALCHNCRHFEATQIDTKAAGAPPAVG